MISMLTCSPEVSDADTDAGAGADAGAGVGLGNTQKILNYLCFYLYKK